MADYIEFRDYFYSMAVHYYAKTGKILTQAEIARKIGISRQSINKILTGKTKLTKMHVIAFCWAIGFPDKADGVWSIIQKGAKNNEL